MAKTISPLWKKILIGFGIALAVLVGTLLFSCNPQRFPQKAYKEVLSNDTLKGKIINDYINAHPPIEGKPEIKYLPGTIQEKIISVKDQKEIDRVKDSTVNAMADTCKGYSLIAFDMGFAQAEKFYRANPFTKTDTVQKTIPDLREANRWRDSAAKKDREIGRLQGQNDTLHETIKEKGNTIAKKDWLLIAAFVLLGISVFFNVKSLISANKVISLIKK